MTINDRKLSAEDILKMSVFSKPIHFEELSYEAQDMIVRALLGEFEDANPPEIPESVKLELAAWAATEDK